MRLGGISRLTQEPCPLSLGLQEPLFLFAGAMMKAVRCNVGRCVSDLHFPCAAQEVGRTGRKAEQVFRSDPRYMHRDPTKTTAI